MRFKKIARLSDHWISDDTMKNSIVIALVLMWRSNIKYFKKLNLNTAPFDNQNENLFRKSLSNSLSNITHAGSGQVFNSIRI